MSEDILTAQQVADWFGCTSETVEERMARGELPGMKLGREWRCPRTALLEVVHRIALKNVDRPSGGNVVPVAAKKPRRRQPPPLQGA